MGERRGVHRVSVGKPERKRRLGRPSCSGRIKLGPQEVEGGGTWIGLIWLRPATGGGHL